MYAPDSLPGRLLFTDIRVDTAEYSAHWWNVDSIDGRCINEFDAE
jgi:hypothetical protein